MKPEVVRLDLADDAPELAIEALRAAREDAPGAARLAAIASGTRTKIPSSSSGGSQGPVSPAGAGVATKVILGTVALGVAVGALAVATRAPSPEPRTEPRAMPTHGPASSTSSAAGSALGIAVDDLPSAAPVVKPALVSAAPSADPLESERLETALLDRAQTTLSAHPEEALALCDEHARRFARGTLVQEREVLAIEALLRAGRREEAEARAARFRRTFARSAHLRRIDVLLAR